MILTPEMFLKCGCTGAQVQAARRASPQTNSVFQMREVVSADLETGQATLNNVEIFCVHGPVTSACVVLCAHLGCGDGHPRPATERWLGKLGVSLNKGDVLAPDAEVQLPDGSRATGAKLAEGVPIYFCSECCRAGKAVSVSIEELDAGRMMRRPPHTAGYSIGVTYDRAKGTIIAPWNQELMGALAGVEPSAVTVEDVEFVPVGEAPPRPSGIHGTITSGPWKGAKARILLPGTDWSNVKLPARNTPACCPVCQHKWGLDPGGNVFCEGKDCVCPCARYWAELRCLSAVEGGGSCCLEMGHEGAHSATSELMAMHDRVVRSLFSCGASVPGGTGTCTREEGHAGEHQHRPGPVLKDSP